MVAERGMDVKSFYRVLLDGRDVGRFYLNADGTGSLVIEGHREPLAIVPKMEGDRWVRTRA